MEDSIKRKIKNAGKGFDRLLMNNTIDGHFRNSENRINAVLGKGPPIRNKTKSRERTYAKYNVTKIVNPIDKRSNSVKKDHAQSQLFLKISQDCSYICGNLDLTTESDRNENSGYNSARSPDNYMNKIKGVYSSRVKDLSDKCSKYQKKSNFLTMSRPIEVNLAGEGSVNSDDETISKNIFLRVADSQRSNQPKKSKFKKEEKTPIKTNSNHISLDIFNSKTPVSSCKESLKTSYGQDMYKPIGYSNMQLTKIEKKEPKSISTSKAAKTRNKVVDYNSTVKDNLNKIPTKKAISFKSSEKVKKPLYNAKTTKQSNKPQTVVHRYDELMSKYERIFNAIDIFDSKSIFDKISQMEQMYKRLELSNKYIQQAHKSMFLFLNMYKDFETKLIYNPYVRENHQIYSICEKIYRDYENVSMHLSTDDSDIESEDISKSWIDSYQNCMSKNQSLLDSIDSSSEFADIQQRINQFNIEINKLRLGSTKPINKSAISQINNIETDSKELIDFSTYLFSNNFCEIEAPNITSSTKTNELPEDKIKVNNKSNQSLLLNMCSLNLSKNIDNYSLSSRKGTGIPQNDKQENKLKLLETQVTDMMKNETKLKGDISRLRIERDNYKSMLQDNSYFNELTQTISNLGNCLLSNKAISDVKFNHQIIMKNLIDDGLSEKIKELDQKLTQLRSENEKLRDICNEEIQSSREMYSIALKYSMLSKNLSSMLANEANSISALEIMTDFLSNMKSTTNRKVNFDDVLNQVSDVISNDNQKLNKLIIQTNINSSSLNDNSQMDTEILANYAFIDDSNFKEKLIEKDNRIRLLEEELSNTSVRYPRKLKKLKSVDSVGKLSKKARILSVNSHSIELGCRNLGEVGGQEIINSEMLSINQRYKPSSSINFEQANSKMSSDGEVEPKPVLFRNVYN